MWVGRVPQGQKTFNLSSPVLNPRHPSVACLPFAISIGWEQSLSGTLLDIGIVVEDKPSEFSYVCVTWRTFVMCGCCGNNVHVGMFYEINQKCGLKS